MSPQPSLGLNSFNTEGFAFMALDRDASGEVWLQPYGSVALSGDFSADEFLRRSADPDGYRHPSGSVEPG
jgi:hypothetical protein